MQSLPPAGRGGEEVVVAEAGGERRAETAGRRITDDTREVTGLARRNMFLGRCKVIVRSYGVLSRPLKTTLISRSPIYSFHRRLNSMATLKQGEFVGSLDCGTT